MRHKVFRSVGYCLAIVLIIFISFSTPAFALEGGRGEPGSSIRHVIQRIQEIASGGPSVNALPARKKTDANKATPTPTPTPTPHSRPDSPGRNVSGGDASGGGSPGSDLPGRHSDV